MGMMTKHEPHTVPKLVRKDIMNLRKSTKTTLRKSSDHEVTWFHKLFFFAGIVSVAIAYVTCFIIMKVQGNYSRDISIPFFSDLGRDSPNIYIFIIGLSIAGVFQLFIPGYTFSEVLRPKLREINKWYLDLLAYVTVIIGTLGALIFPFIAIYPIHSHFEAHCQFAEVYFISTLFNHLLGLALYYGLYKSASKKTPWRQNVKKWALRRAFMFVLCLPYVFLTVQGLDNRYISYEEALVRIEHTSPGISEASLFKGVQKYPWRRKGRKSLADPYPDPIPLDEFERIPNGEPMPEIRVTTLQSFATDRIKGYLLTLNQPLCIFTMSMIYCSFYFDFVFARGLRRFKEE